MHTSQAPLSLTDAHLINAVLTIGYVLPLYFTKYTRLSFSKPQANNASPSKNLSQRWRDDPTVIKARLLSVSASMMASLFLMHYVVVPNRSNATNVSRHSHMFLSFIRSSQSVWDTATRYLGFSFRMHDVPAHFVTPMLFLGPLCGRYLARDLPFMRPRTFNKPNNNLFDWIGFRNYVVVSRSPMDPYEFLITHGFMQAPISEEVVWRSCIVCAYRLAGASDAFIVFFTPISFGSGTPYSLSRQ
jgi:prenyl protein peptidase